MYLAAIMVHHHIEKYFGLVAYLLTEDPHNYQCEKGWYWYCASKCENTLFVNLFVDKGRGLAVGCWLGHQASAGSTQPERGPAILPPGPSHPTSPLRRIQHSVVAGLLLREECVEDCEIFSQLLPLLSGKTNIKGILMV